MKNIQLRSYLHIFFSIALFFVQRAQSMDQLVIDVKGVTKGITRGIDTLRLLPDSLQVVRQKQQEINDLKETRGIVRKEMLKLATQQKKLKSVQEFITLLQELAKREEATFTRDQKNLAKQVKAISDNSSTINELLIPIGAGG